MADQKIKVWITKYALTEGIQLVDAEVSGNSPSMVSYGNVGYGSQYAHGEGKDWHRTPESAMRRAEEMRKKKIASMRKSMAKLEVMTFVAPNAEAQSDLCFRAQRHGAHYPA